MEELSYVLTNNFVPCVPVRLFFHYRSFSPCWPLAFLIFLPLLWNFHVFLPTKFVSFVFISLALALSLLSTWVKTSKITSNILDFVVVFSLYKPGWAWDFPPKKPRVAFSLPYVLIELFYIGIPVVRTDRWTYGQVLTHLLYCTLFAPSKFCISIVFNFSWDGCNTQEK